MTVKPPMKYNWHTGLTPRQIAAIETVLCSAPSLSWYENLADIFVTSLPSPADGDDGAFLDSTVRDKLFALAARFSITISDPTWLAPPSPPALSITP